MHRFRAWYIDPQRPDAQPDVASVGETCLNIIDALWTRRDQYQGLMENRSRVAHPVPNGEPPEDLTDPGGALDAWRILIPPDKVASR
jgi:hypothetical protein